jgi:hypothetical protein
VGKQIHSDGKPLMDRVKLGRAVATRWHVDKWINRIVKSPEAATSFDFILPFSHFRSPVQHSGDLPRFATMSNVVSDKPTGVSEVEAQQTKSDPIYDAAEKVDYDRTGAIDAENAEHNMGVWEAVKAYPAASWWAFVMSCTIVSYFLLLSTSGLLTK